MQKQKILYLYVFRLKVQISIWILFIFLKIFVVLREKLYIRVTWCQERDRNINFINDSNCIDRVGTSVPLYYTLQAGDKMKENSRSSKALGHQSSFSASWHRFYTSLGLYYGDEDQFGFFQKIFPQLVLWWWWWWQRALSNTLIQNVP